MPTPEQFDHYAVLRQRFEQFLRLFSLWQWLRETRFAPPNALRQGPELFSETLRTAMLGWLASLVDTRRNVVSAFKIWPLVFPHMSAEIEVTRLRVDRPFKALLQFRGTVAFHGSPNPRLLQEAKAAIQEPELITAIDSFMALGVKLLGQEEFVTGLQDHLRKVYAVA